MWWMMMVREDVTKCEVCLAIKMIPNVADDVARCG
jgi:hypothetical protein